MITWFANILPFQVTTVMFAVGILMLMMDRERMRHGRLEVEAAFAYYGGWVYIAGAVILGIISLVASNWREL